MQTAFALGIDIHKEHSTLVLIDHESTIVWKRRIKSTPTEYRSACTVLSAFAPLDGLPAAIEPVCGWRWAIAICKERGINIAVANPRKVRLIAESLDKTDENDAAHLAWVRLVDKLPLSYVAPDDIASVRRLVRGYAYLVRLRAGIKNRLQSLATEDGLNIELGNVSTAKGVRNLKTHNASDSTYRALITALDELEQTILPLHNEMGQLTKQHPIVKRLVTIPGIGIVSGVTAFAEIGDFTRFHSPKQLASFAGLIPRQRSSGEHVRYGRITKTGSNLLRYTLVEAAMRIRITDEHALGRYLDRMKADHPDMAAKKLRVALARRILTVMWGMVSSETDFDPGRYESNRSQVTSEYSLATM